MDHIIIQFNPFTVNQDIYVYVNGECKEQAHVDVSRINDVVKGYSNRYDINKIDLCGNENYLSRFKAELQTQFSSMQNYDINIIPR